jgi:sulfite reductase (NADPH) flavoprotein alpha-component
MEEKIYTRENPFFTKLKDRYCLNKSGSDKSTFHLILDLKDSGLSYKPGDSIAVIPSNCPALVSQTLDAIKASGDEIVFYPRKKIELPLREILTDHVTITTINKRIISLITDALPEGDGEKEKLKILLSPGNRSALQNYIEQFHLWDFLNTHTNMDLKLEDLIAGLMPLLPRFYSISSSQMHVGEEVHLTIAHVSYRFNGKARHGVCSEMLCLRSSFEKNEIPIYVQKTHDFMIPEDPNTPMIMIGPGTGIAPFRAFIQERIATKAPGKNWLFFGDRKSKDDFLYEEEWAEAGENGSLRLSTAFSRDQAHKIYVQHRLLENGEEVWKWLESGAKFFVCGDAKFMAKDVEQALHQIFQEHGKMTEEESKAYTKKLRKEKQYLRDIY